MFDILTIGLRLRPFQSTDMEKVLLLYNDMDITVLLNVGLPRPLDSGKSEGLQKAIENHTDMCCIIETIPPADSDSKPEYVGATTLWKEKNPGLRQTLLAIGLVKKFWNKGYGSELTKFMVDYAFRHLNMHRVSLGVFGGNDRAISVYKKCGFVLEVCKRNAIWRNGEWRDLIFMGILVEDWKEKHNHKVYSAANE